LQLWQLTRPWKDKSKAEIPAGPSLLHGGRGSPVGRRSLGSCRRARHPAAPHLGLPCLGAGDEAGDWTRQRRGTGSSRGSAPSRDARPAWEGSRERGAARPRLCPFPQAGEMMRVLSQPSTSGFASEGQNFCGGFSTLRCTPGSGFL